MELITSNVRQNNDSARIDATGRQLIVLLQKGLPLCDRPYAEIARQTGLTESQVIKRISDLAAKGFIKRFGVIVRHHELGYRANAMVVWDIPDNEVCLVADRMLRIPFVTLCYRRTRRPPHWPYNLFCMIHGKDRDSVLQQLDEMIRVNHWQHYSRDVLFSKRRFKQHGANYQIGQNIRDETPEAPEKPGMASL